SNEDALFANKTTLNDKQKAKDVVDTGVMKMANISSPNPFVVLGEDDEEEDNTGASTPAQLVFDV
ncbi:hypothetical protein Tco_0604920, partial [Tanacetum coccineum]